MEIQEATGGRRTGCITPLPHRPLRNAGNHLNLRDNNPGRRRRSDDDLCPRCLAAAARAAPERAAFLAIFNLVLIVFCAIFGLVFHVLWLVPSAHAVIAVHMKREERRHREVVEAIRQHGPPPGYPR